MHSPLVDIDTDADASTAAPAPKSEAPAPKIPKAEAPPPAPVPPLRAAAAAAPAPLPPPPPLRASSSEGGDVSARASSYQISPGGRKGSLQTLLSALVELGVRVEAVRTRHRRPQRVDGGIDFCLHSSLLVAESSSRINPSPLTLTIVPPEYGPNFGLMLFSCGAL